MFFVTVNARTRPLAATRTCSAAPCWTLPLDAEVQVAQLSAEPMDGALRGTMTVRSKEPRLPGAADTVSVRSVRLNR